MKLNAEQLPAHLNKGLQGAYLVAGDEPLQRQEAGDALRQAARRAGFSEREVFHAEPGFQWERLLESAQSLSLFAERRLIELHIPNAKPGPQGSDVLEALINAAAPDTLLVIYTPRLEASVQKSRWVKALERQGVWVQIWPIEAQQLPNWIQRRLAHAGVRASRDAVALLAERVEGNLLAAAQEIEKLKLLYPNQELGVEQILDAVANSSRYDVFALSDCALLGQQERCVRILNGLRAEGVEPTLVLWALTREVRTLLDLSQSAAQGRPLDPLFKKHRIWGTRQKAMQAALKRAPRQPLPKLLQDCTRIDQSIKGMNRQDPWLQLLDVALTLAGKPDPGQTRRT